MDVFDPTLSHLRRLWKSWSRRQRLVSAGAVAVVLIGFAVLLSRGGTPRHVPLSIGGQLGDVDLVSAEAALREHGLTDFRRHGQQLLVPANQVETYRSALLGSAQRTEDLESGWTQRLEQTSLFTSRTQLQEMKDSYLSEELARMIQAVPEIEQAHVRWARESVTDRFRQRQRRKATVFVRPRPETALTDRLVHALRHGVANAVADLDPAQVTIFDLAAGRAYTTEDTGIEVDERILQILDEYTDSLRERIAAQLSHIPGLLVNVYVKVNDLQAAFAPENSPTDPSTASPVTQVTYAKPVTSGPGAPHAALEAQTREAVLPGHWAILMRLADVEQDVHVSLGVPQDYYEAVVRQDGGDPADGRQLARARQRIDTTLERAVVGLLTTSDRVARPMRKRSLHVHLSTVSGPPGSTSQKLRSRTVLFPVLVGTGLVAMACASLWSVRRRRRLDASNHRQTAESEQCPTPTRFVSAETSAPEPKSSADDPPADDALRSLAERDPQAVATILARWLDHEHQRS